MKGGSILVSLSSLITLRGWAARNANVEAFKPRARDDTAASRMTLAMKTGRGGIIVKDVK